MMGRIAQGFKQFMDPLLKFSVTTIWKRDLYRNQKEFLGEGDTIPSSDPIH